MPREGNLGVLSDALLCHIMAYLGPYWAWYGQLLSRRFRRLIRSPDYTRVCLGEAPERDFGRQLVRNDFRHPFPPWSLRCRQDPVLPVDRIPIGVLSACGCADRVYFIDGYHVVHCVCTDGGLFVINAQGDVRGPFTNADLGFTLVLNLPYAQNRDTYLCLTTLPDRPIFKFVSPARLYAGDRSASFSAVNSVTLPCYCFYGSSRMLIQLQEQPVLQLFDCRPYQALVLRWTRTFDDLLWLTDAMMSGDHVVFLSHDDGRVLVTLLSASTGATQWTRPLPFVDCEDLQFEIGLNGFLIGTYAYWVDDETMRGVVQFIDLVSGRTSLQEIALPSEDTYHRFLLPGNVFMHYSAETDSSHYRFFLLDQLRHERLHVVWQPPLRSRRRAAPAPDAPPFLLLYRKRPFARLRYAVIRRPSDAQSPPLSDGQYR